MNLDKILIEQLKAMDCKFNVVKNNMLHIVYNPNFYDYHDLVWKVQQFHPESELSSFDKTGKGKVVIKVKGNPNK